MTPIEYDHLATNRHTLAGPRAILPVLFSELKPRTLLDVGCGLGTWTKVAIELGVQHVLGLDGVEIPKEHRLIPDGCFQVLDFTKPWNLRRRFDMVLCLEVAEHLSPVCANEFVRCLTLHSDRIVFSAAAPGQAGQHHVNCRWPAYWQEIFNANGFVCEDCIRWRIWNNRCAEPWYRQNMFIASGNPQKAGAEDRLRPVVHPEFLFGEDYERTEDARFSSTAAIEGGGMTLGWYLRTPAKGLRVKVVRRIKSLWG